MSELTGEQRVAGGCSFLIAFMLMTFLLCGIISMHMNRLEFSDQFIYAKVLNKFIENDKHYVLVKEDYSKLTLLCENEEKGENDDLTIYHSLKLGEYYEFRLRMYSYHPDDIQYPIILSANDFNEEY